MPGQPSQTSQQYVTLNSILAALIVVGSLVLLAWYALQGSPYNIFYLFTPFPYIVLLVWFLLGYYFLKKCSWAFPGVSLGLACLSGIIIYLAGLVFSALFSVSTIAEMISMFSVLLATRRLPSGTDKK